MSASEERVIRHGAPEELGARRRADADEREDVARRVDAEAITNPAELARQAREAEQYLPPTTTAVIHGPHGKVTLTVPTPMTASGFKPEVSAQTAREAFERRAVDAFKAPSARDHRAARTPRAARSR
jgi:hypothetical protein